MRTLFILILISTGIASTAQYSIRYITRTSTGNFDTTWSKDGVWDTNYIRRNGIIIPMGKDVTREYISSAEINGSSGGVSQSTLNDSMVEVRSLVLASSSFVNISSFGVSPSNPDNRSAIIAARDYIYSNPLAVLTMYIPKGIYQVSDSIKFNKAIRIIGEGTIGQPSSELVFPEGKNGFVFSYVNGENGFGVNMENIKITGQITPGYNTTSNHAIIIRTRGYFNNVHISQFDGNGFYESACALQPNGDNNNYGNADQSVFINCSATYCTNGFFSEGCDAQINSITDCNFSQNRRWGYFGNAFVGDKLDNVHFAFNGVAVPGAKSVVTYANKYWVSKAGYDGYFGDATDSNYNKQPDINPDYWLEITPPMVEHGAWNSSTRYYSGGPATVKTPNGWTTFHHCYTEAFQPPVILNSRSRWEYGTNGAGAVGGIVKNTLYGEEHTYNGGQEIEKYLMVGTTTYDATTVLKSYNDYSKTSSRVVFKGEGTTTDVYLDLKNNTGKSARLNYSGNDLRIYTKDDSLGLTINDAGITAKKFFGDGSALTGISGSGDMLAANNLSDLANASTARTNLGVNTTANISASTDKNFVTDAQATVIGNTSGTNTGDNATNTQYSGLAASKQNNISLTTTGTSGAATLVGSTLNVPNYATGGGSSPTFVNLASNFSSTSVTEAAVTGWSFAVTSGKTYRIEVIADYQTAATTTGGELGFFLSASAVGTIRGFAQADVVNTASAGGLKIPIRICTTADATGSFLISTGVTAINTPQSFYAIVTFTCTVSGTFNVGWATEVAASAAQLNANSSLIYQPLN